MKSILVNDLWTVASIYNQGLFFLNKNKLVNINIVNKTVMAVNENSHNLIGIVRQKELLKKENDTEKNAIICTDILSEKNYGPFKRQKI